MFSSLIKAVIALTLLLPCVAIAEIVHWEVRNVDDPEKTSVMGENFVLTGSFDYNLLTGVISNITLRTSTTDGCIACNDFSGEGIGQTFLSPSGQGGVQFNEENGPDGQILGRTHFLQISGGNSFDDIWAFDVTKPGTYSNLDIDHWGIIVIDDPFDPELFESVGCEDCAFAIGTLVPAPEPETYAMLLAGLSVLGWQARRRAQAGKPI